MNKLFCDLKTDEEKASFFLSGRGYETCVIAAAIQNDVAMAYHRCAEYKKELAQLRAQSQDAAPSQDAEDAARYRYLVTKGRLIPEHWGGRWSIVVESRSPEGDEKEHIDAALDAARTKQEGE